MRLQKRPFTLWLLVLLLVIQSLGGLYGGLSLVLSPTGAMMKMPVSMLEGSPFGTFLVPGFILLLVLGVLPGILAYALISLPAWRWPDLLNIYKGIHWAWTYTLYLGIMLVIWILVEIMWIDHDILQTIFGLIGIIILILTLTPATMRFFGWITDTDTTP
ncbi:MAG: hypothetical protein ACOYNC_10880 [Bacteroidales bacterium]